MASLRKRACLSAVVSALLAVSSAAHAQSMFSQQIPIKLLSRVPPDERLSRVEKT